MTATPSEGIKISELTTLTKGASDYVAGSLSGVSGKLLLNDYTFNITVGMTWTQIAAVFDQAKAVGQIGHSVIIQFANSTAYTQTADYTFTNMGRIRILGLDGDTVDATMAVKLTTTTYKWHFTNCGDTEIKYMQFDNTLTGFNSHVNATNTKVTQSYCYIDGSGSGSACTTNKGSYYLLQNSTLKDYEGIGKVVDGVFEIGASNTFTNVTGTPYFDVTEGFVIDPTGVYVDSDLSNSVTYKSFGNTTRSEVIRARTFKGSEDSISEWQMSFYGSDAAATTLADYEEGTWTPEIAMTGTNFSSRTYTTQTGTYTKVGRMVTIDGTLETNSLGVVGPPTGDIIITGLPYAILTGNNTAGTISRSSAWTTNPDGIEGISNTSTLKLFKRTVLNGDSAVMPYTDANTGAAKNFIRFSVTYRTAT